MKTTNSIGLPVVVFLIFMTLKLCGVISWSWWWVTAPLWVVIPFILIFTIIFIVVTVVLKALKLNDKQYGDYSNSRD
ncbi:MAG: hypothetical protein SNJ31_07850 [Rikenellaceae bacterium]